MDIGKFPEIKIDGKRIDAKNYVERGTMLVLFLSFLVGILGLLASIVCTYGIMLIILLCYPLFAIHVRKKALALIHGSGVKINEFQFPEIHECVELFKERLGITKEISVYIVEDNVCNAMAVRYGKKNVVVITDDMIHAALNSDNPKALAFVIAHELAHIALNHNGIIRSWVGQHLRKLGRLDEYSADAVAIALVGDRTISYKGMLILTVGYGLLPYVNDEMIAAQAEEVSQDKYSRKAEKLLSHPMPMHRIHRILKTSDLQPVEDRLLSAN